MVDITASIESQKDARGARTHPTTTSDGSSKIYESRIGAEGCSDESEESSYERIDRKAARVHETKIKHDLVTRRLHEITSRNDK